MGVFAQTGPGFTIPALTFPRRPGRMAALDRRRTVRTERHATSGHDY
jgi:hypothetical protein